MHQTTDPYLTPLPVSLSLPPPLSPSPPPPSPNKHNTDSLPQETELVTAIPSVVLSILNTIQTAKTKQNSDFDFGSLVLSNLEKRVVKPIGPENRAKTTLTDNHGNIYSITAARREHLRLLFDDEIGLPSLSGLCPLLFQVLYESQPGESIIVAGAGHKDFDYECTCSQEEKR